MVRELLDQSERVWARTTATTSLDDSGMLPTSESLGTQACDSAYG